MVLYLASQSERRRDLLKRMKISFRVAASDYRERMDRSLAPEVLVMRHARGKARKARAPKKARWILAADTIVWHRGKALGKPATWEEALKTVMSLSGRSHYVYTGVTLADRKRGKALTRYARTRVTFKKWSKTAVENYLHKINPFDKAGSYAIQRGPKIVKAYQGSYSNVIGLPCELLREMFAELGF